MWEAAEITLRSCLGPIVAEVMVSPYQYTVDGEPLTLTPVPNARLITPARGHRLFEVVARLVRSSRLALDVKASRHGAVIRGDAEKLDLLQQYPDVGTVRPAFLDPDGRELFLTDEVLVRFQPELPLEERERLVGVSGGMVTQTRGDLWILHVRDPEPTSPLRVVRELEQSAGIVYAEPNALERARHLQVPSDPLFHRQWYLSNTG